MSKKTEKGVLGQKFPAIFLLVLIIGLVCLQWKQLLNVSSYHQGYYDYSDGDDKKDTTSPTAPSSSKKKKRTHDDYPTDTTSTISATAAATKTWNRICYENPYAGVLKGSGAQHDHLYSHNNAHDGIRQVAELAKEWIQSKIQMDRIKVEKHRKEYLQQNHKRFFPLHKLGKCTSLSCVGGPCGDDTSKIVCGIEQLARQQEDQKTVEETETTTQNCIIYSIGGNNLWEFELDLLEKTPCEVHTFDCTGDITRFDVPTHPRLHFHHICLGTSYEPKPSRGLVLDNHNGKCLSKIVNETTNKVQRIQKCGETWTLFQMQQRFNHSRLDLFKLDAEGWEWPLFQSWPELVDSDSSLNNQLLMPMQILVEVHYRTKFPELLTLYNRSVDNREFRYAQDMIDLNARLVRMGYVVVNRDDNKFCRHCTEVTLMRIFCPPSEGLDPASDPV